MKLNQLNETKYTGQTYYIVQAWDPEDGDLETYAGPFNNKATAEKFAKRANETTENKFNNMDIKDEQYRQYLPTFHVQEIIDPQDFLQVMNKHLEQMLG